MKDPFGWGGFAVKDNVLEDEDGADEGEEAGEFWEEGEGFGLGCGCHLWMGGMTPVMVCDRENRSTAASL